MHSKSRIRKPKTYKKPPKHVLHGSKPPSNLMMLDGRPQAPSEILFEERRLKKVNIPYLTGTVSSNKMEKTCTVVVPKMVYHKKLQKYLREFRKIKAHDEHNETRIGDYVKISHDAKRSKTKAYIVSEILSPNRTGYEPLWPIERQKPSLTPERALAPQMYLDHDIYRDNLDGVTSPYISDFVTSESGLGPAMTKPAKLGPRQYHPFSDHYRDVGRRWNNQNDNKQPIPKLDGEFFVQPRFGVAINYNKDVQPGERFDNLNINTIRGFKARRQAEGKGDSTSQKTPPPSSSAE